MMRMGLVLLLLGVAMQPAWAQVQAEQMENRLLRLEREIQTLNRTVYRGETPPPAALSPAPVSSDAALPTGFAVDFEARLAAIEEQLFTLTGQFERLQFEQRQLNQQITALQQDTAFRLGRLEGEDLPAPPATQTLPPPQMPAPALPELTAPPVATPAPVPVPAQAADRTVMPGGIMQLPETWLADIEEDIPAAETALALPPMERGAGDGILGTLSEAELADLRTIEIPAAAEEPPPTEVPEVEETGIEGVYQQAYERMVAGDSPSARQGFERVIREAADDPLADHARFWLADMYFVEGDYRSAALGFGQAYQRNPQGEKAADNLLKMAMSLARLGHKEDACTTLEQLKLAFPNAPARVQRPATAERQALECP